jgi:hypothetical protein
MTTALALPSKKDFALPHDDVVLFAFVHVANMNQVHPWSLGRGIMQRPAMMLWIRGVTGAMHYSIMRQVIALLVNKYKVEFDADGFRVDGQRYIRARGSNPPAILANPSAL